MFGFDLIYGLPGDTLQGFKNSIDFALSLYPNNLELFCLSVLPGTALHESAPGFGLEWQSGSPYHVVNNPTFSKNDLQKAKRLSFATNIFYTKGRAVPYFNGIVELLKQRTLNLSYHPDDLMSGYASDIAFFYENCGRQKNITKVFMSKNGPDWKTV